MYHLMHFRNQYIITNSLARSPLPEWKQMSFGNHIAIHHHPVIETARHVSEQCEIAVIGFMLDADHPKSSNADILQDLAVHRTFAAFLKATFHYGGRYCLFYHNGEGTYIVPDALGLRELYYAFQADGFICASQAKLIHLVAPQEPNDDRAYWEFIASTAFEQNEQAMIGEATGYKHVLHLLPNHYLDLDQQRAVRYFPVEEVCANAGLEACIAFSTAKLQGFFEAAWRRAPLIVPFTAGWDSRVTVAVSRARKDRVQYFVNAAPQVAKSPPDVWVPQHLSQQLQLNFSVVDISPPEQVAAEFRKAFADSYDRPATKFLGGHYAIYQAFGNALCVLTVGSEITRQFYMVSSCASAARLAEICQYPQSPYVVKQCHQWLDAVRSALAVSKMSMMDLFYWEQRIGNWGAHACTAGDIYRESVSLFNCRALLVTMLALRAKYRQYDNRLYRGIIAAAWQALLRAPINPPVTVKSRVLHLARRTGMYQKLKQIKYATNRPWGLSR